MVACTLQCQNDCPSGETGCVRCGASPIILDLSGQGFHLTDAKNGVMFDIAGCGNPIQMGWTQGGADNAFLALPGADGLVHTGQQLFGNFTKQPVSTLPNGFAALNVYDQSEAGGNGDGVIDAHDAVFNSLRLWIDSNHDGVCQLSELHTLQSEDVRVIHLNYQQIERKDQYGNAFRYRARINGDDVGKIAYDVFFVTQWLEPRLSASAVSRSNTRIQTDGNVPHRTKAVQVIISVRLVSLLCHRVYYLRRFHGHSRGSTARRRKTATPTGGNTGCNCCIEWTRSFSFGDSRNHRYEAKENDVSGGQSQDFEGDQSAMGEVQG
jgi:hypothetical protein